MFYFRLDRMFIHDNGVNRLFKKLDKANVQIYSFITTGNNSLPALNGFTKTKPKEEQIEMIKEAVAQVMTSRIFTPIENIKDEHELTFGDTGIVLYQAEEIPADFNWQLVVIGSKEKVRTQAQMLNKFGENVFQGRVIEVQIGTLLADQAFTFTDWTAEMKAKASVCISTDETLIGSLELAKSRIQIMIDKGMDNEAEMLKGLIDLADKRIAEVKSGEVPSLAPDDNAKYYAELVVDLDAIEEPMIADPDVNNEDVSKRYTHDVIRPTSYYNGRQVDLGFVGSCMVHKGDMQIIAAMLRNLEKKGPITFKAPLVVAPPTYNIVDELKAEGDWDILAKYAGFTFDDSNPKEAARTKYENIMYLERPGCNLCMGNQEKAEAGDTVIATSTRLFQGRVVEDSAEKKGESLLGSTPMVVLSTILGRFPSLDEYKEAVDGINLTSFAPPSNDLSVKAEPVKMV